MRGLLAGLLGAGTLAGCPDVETRAAEPPVAVTAVGEATTPESVPGSSAGDSERGQSGTADEAPPAQRSASEVGLATFNVRWFPDGSAHGPGDRTTDVDTVATAIAGLHADAIALEELLLHERGERALTRLRERLNHLTSGRWEVVLDACPRDEGRQHVGILYDASRATLLAHTDVDALSGNAGSGCDGYMRPGVAAALRFASGLDAWIVAVHFDSGTDDAAFARRGRSYAAFAGLRATLAPLYDDADLVVLGDMNTMGNDRGVSGFDEVGQLERVLDAAGYRRLWLEPGCTELSGGHTSMLDQIVVASAMREVAPSTRGRVAGPCGETRCRVRRDDPWLAHVSDHCPVVFQARGGDSD